MRRIGIVKRINGNEIVIHTTEPVNVDKLEQLNGGGEPIVELRFDDNRMISAEQRRKIYALFADIKRHSEYTALEIKERLKFDYAQKKGIPEFSLSDCSVSTARDFISYIIEFCFVHDIPFKDKGLHLQDDINRYLWLCIKYKKCCLCGKPADIHHAYGRVGTGRNRRKIDHSYSVLMALCRQHHNEAHAIGQETFDQKHAVAGIKIKKSDLVRFKIQVVEIDE